MPMDPEIVNQLNMAHGRAIAASAAFQEGNNQTMAQLGTIIAGSNAYDHRLLNGYLADQLFNEGLVQSKAAYHTPVEPSPSPLPAPPGK